MISIIVPIYNVDQYLDQCLRSIYNQSYSNWECILVDDGSSDRSGSICDDWHEVDKRFICIHQNNQGVSAARNTGLKSAKGDFIVFIDSDDYVSSNYILNLKQEIKCNDIDLVVGGFFKIYNDGRKESVLPTSNSIIEMAGIYSDVFLQNIGLFYGPCIKMYRRKCIEKFSISFPEDLSLGEDIIFNFQYLSYCKKIKLTNTADYYYRIQDNGLCNKYRVDLFDCLFRIWNFRRDVMVKKHMWNNDVMRYFSLQLWGYTYDCILGKDMLPYYKISRILRLVDVSFLKKFQKDFLCAKWIKFCILHRLSMLIYLLTSIRRYGL